MEIPTSAVTGAVRIVVQVAAKHRRPVLEIYHELRNVFGPPHEVRSVGGPQLDKVEKSLSRHQDVFVQFILVNLGGARAENVILQFEGEFDRDIYGPKLADTEFFNGPIAQLAPGQSLFLFRVDIHDFSRYPEGGGKPIGLKDESFAVSADYSGPMQGLNRIYRWWSRFRGRLQYRMTYTFDPRIIRTDYPSPEYHG